MVGVQGPGSGKRRGLGFGVWFRVRIRVRVSVQGLGSGEIQLRKQIQQFRRVALPKTERLFERRNALQDGIHDTHAPKNKHTQGFQNLDEKYVFGGFVRAWTHAFLKWNTNPELSF